MRKQSDMILKHDNNNNLLIHLKMFAAPNLSGH